MEWVPSMPEVLGCSLSEAQTGCSDWLTCDSPTWKVESGESEGQGPLRFYSEFKVNLGYWRACLKDQDQNPNQTIKWTPNMFL